MTLVLCSVVSLNPLPTSERWVISWIFHLGWIWWHHIRVKLLKFFHCCIFQTVPAHLPHNQLNLKSCSLPPLIFYCEYSQSDSAAVGCCSMFYEPQSNFVVVQLSGDRRRCLKRSATKNHKHVGLHRTNIITGPLCCRNMVVIVSRIFALQITDMADSHWINITDILHHFYNFAESFSTNGVVIY